MILLLEKVIPDAMEVSSARGNPIRDMPDDTSLS
ncbi:hypothetical protein A2U01_0040701 [Trifolium medium]|uniref:Uncharacterized protein n=1 Tax=Trifolium medium TaxID=97028 RepID=A0A392Q5Y4_9FABA|nr:hypothetical protein [Trifolium medium]